MTKLIFIRHGESSYNLTKRYTGQTDVPLTEKGVEQANITAKYILKQYKIDQIYSSDLSRAINTAMPVAKRLGLEIKTDERLREIFAGDWQGLYFSEVRETYKTDYELYCKDRLHGKTTNGEGMPDVLKRALEAVTEIADKNDGKTVLISTHNGPLMALQLPFLKIDFDSMKNLSNNSITEVDYDGNDFKVVKLGYDEHLGGLITGFKEKAAN